MDPVVLTARAFLLASTAVLLGVAGHVSAAGLLPGPAALVLLWAVAVAVCLALLRTPAGPVRVVALLVGGQTAIHVALSVTAGHVGDVATRTAAAAHHVGAASLPLADGRRVGSLQDSWQVAGQSSSLAPSLPVGHLVSDLQAHAPMMVVHLLAAAGVGLWLAVGERHLWTLLGLLAAAAVRLLLPVLGAVPVPVARQAIRRTSRRTLRPLLLLDRSVSRRGPPVLLAT